MVDNTILNELEYDPNTGVLSYKGVRYLLIRPETLIAFQKAFERCDIQGSDDALFQGGFRGGKLSSQRYKEVFGFSDQEIIAFMMKMGNEIGWGAFTVDHFDPDAKTLRITVEHSAFAEPYGNATRGMCHMLRGVLSGMAATLFKQDCHADEIQCVAKGDDQCVFVLEGNR